MLVMESESIILNAQRYFTWTGDPNIFVLNAFGDSYPLRYYGVCFMLSFLLGYWLIYTFYRKEGKNVSNLDILLNYMLVGTIVGARLGHCIFYQPEFFFHNPIEILMVHKGGLASHGGIVGILIALFIYSKRHPQEPYVWLLDRIAVPSALGSFFIRMGNFFNSEIVGLPTDKPWAIIFSKYEDDPFTPRHPTMLYESFSYLIIFGLMLLIYKNESLRQKRGFLTGFLLTSIFVVRFFCEFTKVKQEDYGLSSYLNVGHYLSIPFVIGGIILMIKSWAGKDESSNAT